jgi:hypothetical protein
MERDEALRHGDHRHQNRGCLGFVPGLAQFLDQRELPSKGRGGSGEEVVGVTQGNRRRDQKSRLEAARLLERKIEIGRGDRAQPLGGRSGWNGLDNAAPFVDRAHHQRVEQRLATGEVAVDRHRRQTHIGSHTPQRQRGLAALFEAAPG